MPIKASKEPRWTTVVEWRDGGKWEFFSQQCVKPDERELTDQEYLAACRKAFPDYQMRVAPPATS